MVPLTRWALCSDQEREKVLFRALMMYFLELSDGGKAEMLWVWLLTVRVNTVNNQQQSETLDA